MKLSFAKLLPISAVAMLACGTIYSAPVSAATRTVYINAGGLCHGINTADDTKLTRSANQLQNDSGSDITVVCNLPTDITAVKGDNQGVVAFVAIWGRNHSASPSKTFSCTLTDGFYAQAGSTVHQPNSGTSNPAPLPVNGTQGYLIWAAGGSNRWLGPVNLMCSLQSGTELNDIYLSYDLP